MHDKINDPKYLTVHTDDRFMKPVARLVTKKTMRKAAEKHCELYKKGCRECFTDKQEMENPCYIAWKLTIGKGKKLY